MNFVNALDKHRMDPDLSMDSYARNKRLDLARKIRSAKKIYLDTKF